MFYDYASFHSGMRERFGSLLVLSLLSVLFVYTINARIFLGDSAIYSESVGFGLHSAVLFMNVVVLLFLIHPIQVRRNFAVSGISPNPGTFLQRCADVMLRYGNPAVSLSVTNDIQQQNALAYGLPGWRRLLLGGGLRVVAAKRPDRFEAVMAHEASHFNHGDVSFAYLSRAILHSLVYAFGIVLLAYIFWIYRRGLWIENESLTLVTGTLVFQVGVVTFLLLLGNLEYRALLRSREHYADVEATRYVSSAVLLDTISAAHSTDGVPSGTFGTIFRTHPTQSNRNRVVESPHVLLRRNPFQAFLTGLVGSQILLFANMIAREFPGSAVPSGVTLETISAATFAALIVVLLFAVIASENLRVATSYALGFSSLKSMLASSVVSNTVMIGGVVSGYCWWLVWAKLSGDPFVLQLVKQNITDQPLATCVALISGMLCCNIVLSVFLRGVVRHCKLQQFSMKWRVFLSVLWIWGAYHATDVIGTILPVEQMGGPGLDKRLGADASAVVPLLVCFLTWLYIRLRNADREKAALPNIEGLVIDKAIFGFHRDRLALIAVCIGIIIADSMILQFNPNVNVVQSREVNIPAGSPSYCLRSDGQIYQPANSLCYGIDRLVTP